MDFTTVKIFHITAVITLFAASLYKNIMLSKSSMSQSQLYACLSADKISGVAAGILVISGLHMLFGFSEQRSHYLNNTYFLAKMAVFISASALIIFTKIYLRKNARKGSEIIVGVPPIIRLILRIDILGLLLLVFLAHSMLSNI
jgi:uncharacterized membrane protein